MVPDIGDTFMGKADRISGVFWLVFGLFICIESYRLGLGTLHKPGPGFLFFWTSIALAIMSLIVLIQAWSSKGAAEAETSIFAKQKTRKVVLVLFSLFLYAIFMETIGFIPITLLLFIYLLGIIEKKGWFKTIFTSVVVTVAAYLIFETWLQSQLPKGLLGFLRF
jgi:putative tricarboxylic transport membrane protein